MKTVKERNCKSSKGRVNGGYIMKQSCWSCKHCINDYFATGTMDCKKQDDMTEDEFENYYGDNGGENCPYYEEDTRE